MIFLILILLVAAIGGVIVFNESRSNQKAKIATQDSIEINNSPSDLPYLTIPENAPPQYPPFVGADVINHGPSSMTGMIVYLNGQEIDDFNPLTLFGGPSQVGSGGTLDIKAQITNGMTLTPGTAYTVTITAGFEDGTTAAATAQVTGRSVSVG